jgi:hypothetical protein
MTKSAVESALEDVRMLKTMLIQVATGERRIQDADTEYAQLRSKVAAGLRAFGIKDPNPFHSLWDWYGYWRSNGLGTYQSRRDFVNSQYKSVVDALEEATALNDREPKDEDQPFSVRHGYAADNPKPPITIRGNAPENVRRTIVEIAANTRGWDYDDQFGLAVFVTIRTSRTVAVSRTLPEIIISASDTGGCCSASASRRLLTL